MDEIKNLFAPDYNVYQLFLAPGDVGHSGINRRRTFIFCSHKECCEYLWDLHDAMELLKGRISEEVQTLPSDYRVSSSAARLLENQALARKRKCEYNTDPWIRNVRS